MTVVVMGVSGCGKTVVAQALAQRVGCDYLDADHFHPPENIDKMSRGIPLTDLDRVGWLGALAQVLKDRTSRQQSTVLACSALKEAYRQVLRVAPEVRFLFLQGTYELIESRLRARSGHFMKANLLKSQFQTLEVPASGPGTDCLAVDIALSVEAIVERARTEFVK